MTRANREHPLRNIHMEIQSSDIKQAIINATKINPSAASIPSKLSPYVSSIIDVTPFKVTTTDIVKSLVSTATGSSTIFTTPTDRDFYLTGAALSATADVTADNTSVVMNVVVGGATIQLLRIQKQSVTAVSGLNQSREFSTPIKLDRGSVIAISSTFSAGACTFWGNITGFTLSKF